MSRRWLWARGFVIFVLAAGFTGCARGNLDAIVPLGSKDAGGASSEAGGPPATDLEALQRAFVELRFGMLIHLGILTYTGQWSEANLPIDQFNPGKLDAGQWADAAVAAKMKFALLVVRHADGFALWDSAVSNFDVGSIPWQQGRGDVVRAFVDAFRARGLVPGFFYSIWDNTEGIGNGPLTEEQFDYVKAQITELLTNYGPIRFLVFTGWSWRLGHKTVSYQEIRELVKSLQPDCLFLDVTLLSNLWDSDVAYYDESRGMFADGTDTIPGTQAQKINTSGGNDWYWAPDIGGYMSMADIIDGHLRKLEPCWTNFLLSTPPNRDGLLDQAIVDELAEIGSLWSPDVTRPPLPAQPPQNEFPYAVEAATATSGTAGNAIDGIETLGYYSTWESSGPMPQSITLDLGEAKPDVGLLNYVPRVAPVGVPQTDGAITSYAIATSIDGANFVTATTGSWPVDGRMKVATFGPVAARYVRLEAQAVAGSDAVATEITVGGRR